MAIFLVQKPIWVNRNIQGRPVLFTDSPCKRLKHFQSSSKMDKQNVKHFLLAGQVRYQKYDKNCRILRPGTKNSCTLENKALKAKIHAKMFETYCTARQNGFE